MIDRPQSSLFIKRIERSNPCGLHSRFTIQNGTLKNILADKAKHWTNHQLKISSILPLFAPLLGLKGRVTLNLSIELIVIPYRIVSHFLTQLANFLTRNLHLTMVTRPYVTPPITAKQSDYSIRFCISKMESLPHEMIFSIYPVTIKRRTAA